MPRRLVLAAFLSFFIFFLLASAILYLLLGCFSYDFIFFPLFLLPLLSLPEVSACLCFHAKTFTFSTYACSSLSSHFLSYPHSHCEAMWAQMLHSVPPPFSMWSCEKPREPRRMHRSCQAPHLHNSSLWTQQQTTQRDSKNTFCWPMLSGTLLSNGSGWAQLRSECWNGVGVKVGVKSIKVIWLLFYIIAFVTLSAAFSRRLPKISPAGQLGISLSVSTLLWSRDANASVSGAQTVLCFPARSFCRVVIRDFARMCPTEIRSR